MKIHPAKQNTPEWMMARIGVVTASEFDSLISPEWKIRTGEGPKTYLATKVAEAWSGMPLPGFEGSWSTDQGKFKEEEALPSYTLETGEQIEQVGLCTVEDWRVGCSPDGLIGDDCGIEIKCPMPHTHVKYLLGGTLPKEYAAQVHGSMLVTGRPRWKFMSYARRFPSLILTVERDEEIQDKISEALEIFLAQFEAALQKLEEINGGPRTKRQSFEQHMDAQFADKP